MSDQLDGLRVLSELEELDCSVCGGVSAFEVPPCADGHGDDCPERVCTGCGAALVLGPPLPADAGVRWLAVVA